VAKGRGRRPVDGGQTSAGLYGDDGAVHGAHAATDVERRGLVAEAVACPTNDIGPFHAASCSILRQTMLPVHARLSNLTVIYLSSMKGDRR